MHAVTDAIFGALAEGDIGQWFPPSDPPWKGVASEIFLRKAVERRGRPRFAISHLDCTLICEAPEDRPARRRDARGPRRRSPALGEDRISVKATTSERLGFTGRGEGIAALATATLVRPMTRLIATFGYVGLLPGPAGTWGSLAALPTGYLLHLLGGSAARSSPEFSSPTDSASGRHVVETFEKDDLDPSHIVIDEVVGQWIALLPLSAGLWLAGVRGAIPLAWLGVRLSAVPALRHLEARTRRLGRPPQGTDGGDARRRDCRRSGRRGRHHRSPASRTGG